MQHRVGLVDVEPAGGLAVLEHDVALVVGVAAGEATLLGDVLDAQDVLGEVLVGEGGDLALPGRAEDVVHEGVVSLGARSQIRDAPQRSHGPHSPRKKYRSRSRTKLNLSLGMNRKFWIAVLGGARAGRGPAGRHRSSPLPCVTIHSEHPFADPEPGATPPGGCAAGSAGRSRLWTTGAGPGRAGLTVSSVLVAHGEPARVLGLVDPDADLAEAVAGDRYGGRAAARLGAPRPRRRLRRRRTGPRWRVPAGDLARHRVGAGARRASPAWAGVRRRGPTPPRSAGPLLLDGGRRARRDRRRTTEPLVHRRGRYVRPTSAERREPARGVDASESRSR